MKWTYQRRIHPIAMGLGYVSGGGAFGIFAGLAILLIAAVTLQWLFPLPCGSGFMELGPPRPEALPRAEVR